MSTSEVAQSVKRWPSRRRCYVCKTYFLDLVIKQLYCSYECAGLPPPDPTVKPRTCYNGKGKSYGKPKRVYFSIEEAKSSTDAMADPTLGAYECPNCFLIHLGHPPGSKEWTDIELAREQRRLADTVKLISHRRGIEVIQGERPPIREYPDWSHAWWMQPPYLEDE